MLDKLFRYGIYIIALPASGFFFMAILKPLTAGAHDGGYLGMTFGLLLAEIVFTAWISNLRWYLGAFVGGFVGIIIIVFSFFVTTGLRGYLNQSRHSSIYVSHTDPNEILLQWIFFIVIIIASIIFLELINRFVEREEMSTDEES